jgi:hypothetical protein
MLGLEVSGYDQQIKVISPSMPDWLDWIKIENLNTGGEMISLRFERAQHAVGIEVLERRGASVDIQFM